MNQYRAFLSYSHFDSRLARKLHRRVEEFQVPPRERASRSRRPCTPIFLDRDELGAEMGLTQAVFSALAKAERLIVLCTPRAAQSSWVEAEVGYFVKEFPERPVIAFIAGSDPLSNLTSGGHAPGYLTPTLQGLAERGTLEVIDGRATGRGFVGGIGAIAAHITGLDADLLEKADTARRRRTVATTTAVMAVAGIFTMLALLMLVLAGSFWLSSTGAAYSSYGELEAGLADLWNVSGQAGPVTSLNKEVWQSLDERLQSIVHQAPTAFAVPGGRGYLEMIHAGLTLERSAMAFLLGDYGEALVLARRGRDLADQVLARQENIGANVLAAYSLYGGMPYLPLSRQRLDTRAWLVLSAAQSANGESTKALHSAQAALEAAHRTMLLPTADDSDRLHYIDVVRHLAVVSGEFNDMPMDWKKAFEEAVILVVELPTAGQTTAGVPWDVVRAHKLSQVRADQAGVAARWHEEETARTAIAEAEHAMAFLDRHSPNPLRHAFVEDMLNLARVQLADETHEWQEIAEVADKSRETLSKLEFVLRGQYTLQLKTARNLMNLALARSYLGEEFRPHMIEALEKARAVLAARPNDEFRKAALADMLVDVVDIETRAGSCAAAQQARREGKDLYEELLETRGNQRQNRAHLAELNAIAPCSP